MTQKTYIYEWDRLEFNELSEIEKEAFRKTDDLNDKLLDAKIILDEIAEDWADYIRFLEDKKISKKCAFGGGELTDFDEELLNAIVNTLRKSLNDTQGSLNYNSKKISLNLVIDG